MILYDGANLLFSFSLLKIQNDAEGKNAHHAKLINLKPKKQP